MLLTAAVYLMIPRVWTYLKNTPPKTILIFTGIGLLVALHWVTFYGSIKIGNSVSVTLACLGSASFFTSIFEPILMKTTFNRTNIITGLLVIVGVIFISISLPQENNPNISYGWAIIVGVFSASIAALFSTLNKKYIQDIHPLALSTIEMVSGALALSLIIFGGYLFGIEAISNHIVWLPTTQYGAEPSDWIWLVFLSVLCTNVTFYLASIALNKISAFTANLALNLEPIYGILLGIFVFKENKDLNLSFYLGTTIILVAIFANSLISKPSQTTPSE